jgi:hypothetical protein
MLIISTSSSSQLPLFPVFALKEAEQFPECLNVMLAKKNSASDRKLSLALHSVAISQDVETYKQMCCPKQISDLQFQLKTVFNSCSMR